MIWIHCYPFFPRNRNFAGLTNGLNFKTKCMKKTRAYSISGSVKPPVGRLKVIKLPQSTFKSSELYLQDHLPKLTLRSTTLRLKFRESSVHQNSPEVPENSLNSLFSLLYWDEMTVCNVPGATGHDRRQERRWLEVSHVWRTGLRSWGMSHTCHTLLC